MPVDVSRHSSLPRSRRSRDQRTGQRPAPGDAVVHRRRAAAARVHGLPRRQQGRDRPGTRRRFRGRSSRSSTASALLMPDSARRTPSGPRSCGARRARLPSREEDHRGQADRQHEHDEHREDERDALLLAKKAAPGRAEAAKILSLREHVTRVVYGGRHRLTNRASRSHPPWWAGAARVHRRPGSGTLP